ncbi:MAG: hypothetical protein RR182_08925, partial [Alistipes sp.]
PDPTPDPTREVIQLTAPVDQKVLYYSKAGDGTIDNYYVGLAAGEVTLYTNDQGKTTPIPATKEGKIIYLDLYAALATDKEHLVLPEGDYQVNEDPKLNGACAEYTYGLWYMSDGKLDYANTVSGAVKVKHTATGGYIITASFEMIRESDRTPLGTLNFNYEGALQFVNADMPDPEPDPDPEQFPVLDTDITTTFLGVDAVYMGIPAYSSPIDAYVFDFYDDPTPLPDGTLDEGNVLRLEIYTEHQWYFPGEKVKVPAGVYTMTDGRVPVAAGVGSGDIWDSGYGLFPFGSYLRHLNAETEVVCYGFMAGTTGTVTVEMDEAKNYTFTIDLTTKEGRTVKGTYAGPMVVRNEAHDPEPQTQSRIYEDKVLDLAATTTAKVDFYGNSKNQMTNFYHIFAQDPVSHQGFQLEFMTPNGKVGEGLVGTYKVSETLSALNLVPYTYIRGDIQLVSGGAAMIGTWGYYEENAAGKAVAFAPSIKGDLVIAKVEGDQTRYTIEYVMTDDNLAEPHTMTAHFKGSFEITDHTQAAASFQPFVTFPSSAKAQHGLGVTKKVPPLTATRYSKAMR